MAEEKLLKKSSRRSKKPTKRSWTKESVKKHLRFYHKKGYDLRQQSMQEIDSGLVSAAYRFYNGWAAAIEDAGIPPDYTRTIKWNPKKVIEGIRERNKEKKSLEYERTRRENHKLVQAARKYFGTWMEAVKAAGFNYDGICQQRTWNENKVMEAIQERIEHGEDLRAYIVTKEDSGLVRATYRYLGSWTKAVDDARKRLRAEGKSKNRRRLRRTEMRRIIFR
ncbi:MAG: hypothetical protein AB1546_11360 [bacterium]